jgi:hypothetical protein
MEFRLIGCDTSIQEFQTNCGIITEIPETN